MSSTQLDLRWDGRTVAIEVQSLNPQAADPATLVFLHEGLGSVAMWRGFPARLCELLGVRGWVYSRPGYGRSTPWPPEQRWAPDYLHRQALELLPALLQALDVQRPWLLGHSDGGSIALLYATQNRCRGVIALAPHILVEACSLHAIEQARQAYLQADLRQRLARYHAQPDSAFWGWCEAWLNPAFKHWNIEAEVAAIACPVLAVQGLNDPYGSLEQIRGLARRVPQTELLELPHCGHSPHLEQAPALLQACQHFYQAHCQDLA